MFQLCSMPACWLHVAHKQPNLVLSLGLMDRQSLPVMCSYLFLLGAVMAQYGYIGIERCGLCS